MPTYSPLLSRQFEGRSRLAPPPWAELRVVEYIFLFRQGTNESPRGEVTPFRLLVDMQQFPVGASDQPYPRHATSQTSSHRRNAQSAYARRISVCLWGRDPERDRDASQSWWNGTRRVPLLRAFRGSRSEDRERPCATW